MKNENLPTQNEHFPASPPPSVPASQPPSPDASRLTPHAPLPCALRPRSSSRIILVASLFSLCFLPFLIICLLTRAHEYTEAFPNLIPNPSFELDANKDGVPDKWRKEETNKAIATLQTVAKAPDGSRAVSLQGKSTWSCLVPGIIPGRTYLLSLWLNRDGWRDGEYPTVRIFDQDLYLNEAFSFGSWVHLSWLLTAPPGLETILTLVNPGLTHRIWFDTLSLSEFRVSLHSPKEGASVDSSQPVFFWSLPEDGRIFDLTLEVSRTRDFSAPVRLETVSPWGNTARLHQPLDNGTWFWRVQAFYHRALLASSPVQAFKVKAKAEGTRSEERGARNGEQGLGIKGYGLGNSQEQGTSIQHPASSIQHPASSIQHPASSPNASRLTPNALPNAQRLTPNAFYPLGIYAADPASFPELKAGGFNCVQSYATDLAKIEEVVRQAEQHGLKAMIRVPRGACNRDTASFIGRMRSSPAVLAWYLEDEPEGRAVPPAYLWRVREYVRSHDPEHPTSLVVLRSKKAVDYAKAVDVIMVDPYPVPQMPMTWLADSLEEARRAVFDEKPVWAVIQAFSWADSPCGDEKREWGRLPTYEEERCLSYLAVVHGARGLYYFSAAALNKDRAHWKNIEKVLKELNQVYPLLLASSSSGGAFQQSADQSVHYLVRTVPQNLVSDPKGIIQQGDYVIAVNVSDKPVKTTLSIPAGADGEAALLFEDRRVPAASGALTDDFGPYGVHVYALRR